MCVSLGAGAQGGEEAGAERGKTQAKSTKGRLSVQIRRANEGRDFSHGVTENEAREGWFRMGVERSPCRPSRCIYAKSGVLLLGRVIPFVRLDFPGRLTRTSKIRIESDEESPLISPANVQCPFSREREQDGGQRWTLNDLEPHVLGILACCAIPIMT